jgi:hypothetical protein
LPLQQQLRLWLRLSQPQWCRMFYLQQRQCCSCVSPSGLQQQLEATQQHVQPLARKEHRTLHTLHQLQQGMWRPVGFKQHLWKCHHQQQQQQAHES